MNNQFPQINLAKFAHSYQLFLEAATNLLKEAEAREVLAYILTDDINSQYKYSNQIGKYCASYYYKQFNLKLHHLHHYVGECLCLPVIYLWTDFVSV